MFVKLSIGVFLLRLATQKVYIWIIRVALVIVTLWSIGIFIWNLFQCTPVEKQWDFRITTGHCAGPNEIIAAAYALSVMTVLSDWFFVSCRHPYPPFKTLPLTKYLQALIPIPMLWGVKMTKQAKATVIVILGLGVLYAFSQRSPARSITYANTAHSASIATLIRLKFLSGLELSDDLMCKCQLLPSHPTANNDERPLTIYSLRHRRNNMEYSRTRRRHNRLQLGNNPSSPPFPQNSRLPVHRQNSQQWHLWRISVRKRQPKCSRVYARLWSQRRLPPQRGSKERRSTKTHWHHYRRISQPNARTSSRPEHRQRTQRHQERGLCH